MVEYNRITTITTISLSSIRPIKIMTSTSNTISIHRSLVIIIAIITIKTVGVETMVINNHSTKERVIKFIKMVDIRTCKAVVVSLSTITVIIIMVVVISHLTDILLAVLLETVAATTAIISHRIIMVGLIIITMVSNVMEAMVLKAIAAIQDSLLQAAPTPIKVTIIIIQRDMVEVGTMAIFRTAVADLPADSTAINSMVAITTEVAIIHSKTTRRLNNTSLCSRTTRAPQMEATTSCIIKDNQTILNGATTLQLTIKTVLEMEVTYSHNSNLSNKCPNKLAEIQLIIAFDICPNNNLNRRHHLSNSSLVQILLLAAVWQVSTCKELEI